MTKYLDKVKLVIFDLDGTLVLDNQLLPGARQLFNHWPANQIDYCFCSNNTSKTKYDIKQSLEAMGVPNVTASTIFTPLDEFIDYVHHSAEITSIYPLATQGVCEYLSNQSILCSDQDPDAVFLCFDKEITYQKLEKAAMFLTQGKPLIASHCDKACPTKNGFIPDAGAFLALFDAALNIQPKKVFGKPHVSLLQHIIRSKQVQADEVLMVGDRIYTDIKMGRRAGCLTALVLTGESTEHDVTLAVEKPTWVLQHVGQLVS